METEIDLSKYLQNIRELTADSKVLTRRVLVQEFFFFLKKTSPHDPVTRIFRFTRSMVVYYTHNIHDYVYIYVCRSMANWKSIGNRSIKNAQKNWKIYFTWCVNTAYKWNGISKRYVDFSFLCPFFLNFQIENNIMLGVSVEVLKCVCICI